MKIEATTTATVTSAFQENSQPSCARRLSLAITRGTPPSSVPAGQSHLQNAGVTTPLTMRKYSGRAMTITTSTMYFITVRPPRPSTFFEFLRGNFIQEFLDEPKGAQKGAHCPPEQRAKEQQYAQQIERHRRGEIVERRLQRPQRTGGDGPGAAVAVQSRHAEFLAVSPIDRSLEKAADIGVVENRRQHLDNAPPSLRAQCAQPRHHPMPMHSMQMKIAF